MHVAHIMVMIQKEANDNMMSFLGVTVGTKIRLVIMDKDTESS